MYIHEKCVCTSVTFFPTQKQKKKNVSGVFFTNVGGLEFCLLKPDKQRYFCLMIFSLLSASHLKRTS